MYCPNSTNQWLLGNVWKGNLQQFQHPIGSCEWTLKNEVIIMAHATYGY